METFRPNRALLNPKFEGYKLNPIPQNAVVQYDLQYKPTQATSSNRLPLSFEEVRSRITHNHLCVSRQARRALYLDADFNVVVIDLGLESLQPEFRVVYQLPRPTLSEETFRPEYPSAAFHTPDVVFVSDGHGHLYILDISQAGQTHLLGRCTLPSSEPSEPPIPFRIHDAVSVAPDLAIVILSSRFYDGASGGESPQRAKNKHVPIQYDVWAAQFVQPIIPSVQQVSPMSLLWRRRGNDVPIYTAYDESRQAFLLSGSSPYGIIDVPLPPQYEPSADELAPIPRPGENLADSPNGTEKPRPYSWTQTSDSVTVAFPLPSTTPKSSISVTLTPKTITCHIQGAGTSVVPVPDYTLKPFWDDISPSSSYWTWDREAERAFGLLTLHLDKQHEGRKWMHVFDQSSDPHDPGADVPETLDPSELWQITETLDKYTRSLREGEDISGLGLGKGVPSLVEGEMDEEVDSAVGRLVYLTWVGNVTSNSTEIPLTLLSIPLPGVPVTPLSLIVKNDIDGTMFSLDRAADGNSAPIWQHQSTFSALGFVLASKQDTRFTYHLSSKAVLAFENGTRNRGGNVYIYSCARPGEVRAKQAVLRVSDGLSGSLLGVGGLRNDGGNTVLLCLTEGQLVLIHGVV